MSLQQPWICLGCMSIHSLDPWSGDETVQFMWFGLWGQLWLFKFALQFEEQVQIFGANLAGMSPIGLCNSHGYV